MFRKPFGQFLTDSCPHLAVGDFNMSFKPGEAHWLSGLMQRHGLELQNKVLQTTSDNTLLDLAYGLEGSVSAEVLESPFSFHRPVCCSIKRS